MTMLGSLMMVRGLVSGMPQADRENVEKCRAEVAASIKTVMDRDGDAGLLGTQLAYMEIIAAKESNGS